MAGTVVTAASRGGVSVPAGLAVVLAIAAVILSIVLTDPGGVLLVLSYGIPGLILALRRPGEPIAWLLLLMAVGMLLGTTRVTATADELLAGEADTLGRFTAWANGTGWMLVFAGFIGIVLVFPGRSLPAGRWGLVARLLIAVFIPIALVLVLGPVVNVTLPGYPSGLDVPNPFGLPVIGTSLAQADYQAGTLWMALSVPTFVAMASLLARFRRSIGVERLQYRWLAWAVVLVVTANCAWAIVMSLLQEPQLLAAGIILVSYPTIPIAIVVAVLRYRLYEIDRLVSRTLGWGIATATVAVVFVVAVLALQAALVDVTQAETLAVAASTLLALAVFQPVRSRVQAIVDRRFDRPRVEAERSVAAYAGRLRNEVDIGTLTRDIEQTAVGAVRPSVAAVWIRRVGGRSQRSPDSRTGRAGRFHDRWHDAGMTRHSHRLLVAFVALAAVVAGCSPAGSTPSPAASPAGSGAPSPRARPPAGVRPIVIDTDLAPDDVLAIMLLLRQPRSTSGRSP